MTQFDLSTGNKVAIIPLTGYYISGKAISNQSIIPIPRVYLPIKRRIRKVMANNAKIQKTYLFEKKYQITFPEMEIPLPKLESILPTAREVLNGIYAVDPERVERTNISALRLEVVEVYGKTFQIPIGITDIFIPKTAIDSTLTIKENEHDLCI